MDRTIKIIKSNRLIEITTAPAAPTTAPTGTTTGRIVSVTPLPQDAEATAAITKETSQSGRTKQVLDKIIEIGGLLGKAGLATSVTGIGASVGLSITAVAKAAVTVATIAQSVLSWKEGDKLSSALYLIKAAPGFNLLTGWKVIGPKVRWKIASKLIKNQQVRTFAPQISQKFANLTAKVPMLGEIAQLSAAILSGDVKKIAASLSTTTEAVNKEIAAAETAQAPAQTGAQPGAVKQGAPATMRPATRAPLAPGRAAAPVQEQKSITKARRSRKLSDLYLS